MTGSKSIPLLLWLGRLAGFFGKRLHPFELLLKSPGEIMGAVLEKDDKTECEKHKEDEPKKPPEQRHVPMVTYSLAEVNEGEWPSESSR